jgi:hypothetical protein
MRSEEFEAIVGELVTSEIEGLHRDLRNAVRSGDHHQAALSEGRIQAVEGLPASLKRLAERYKLVTPDRN